MMNRNKCHLDGERVDDCKLIHSDNFLEATGNEK